MSSIKFDGKVVIVTGAGGGLGKSYALAFAERGAFVVVNDLGGDLKGSGKSTTAADNVVNEIRSKNGVAIPSYDSVESAENIIKTAIDNFGRIDILVNNAGILRDKSFSRTSDLDWDLVHRIHLRSSFQLTRAAWPYMQKHKYGRIIMTSSGSGLYGNFGQSNYSAAKLGLLGLSNTLSIEGAKYNILCNTIAPLAKSRLTEPVMPQERLQNLKVEYVAPLVLYLCHESCLESGSLFEVSAGWIRKLRWQKSAGKLLLRDTDCITPEDVRDNWNEVTNFDQPIYHSSISESTNYALNMASKNKMLTAEVFNYDFKDVILYALSINMNSKDDLKFLYENHEDFSVFPTYAIVSSQFSISSNVATKSFALPEGVNFDPLKMLHGEHYLEVFKPFSKSGRLHLVFSLVDVLDKGSGAALIMNVDTFDEHGEKVCFNQNVIFLVDGGNFGGKKDSNALYKISNKKFDRQPDHVMDEKIITNQSAIFRLNGDFNPHNIDPEIAIMTGFPSPIIHGVCSLGIAVKHVLKLYCDNDASCFKSVKTRFNRPVFPDQTFRTNTWLEKENSIYKVYFECRVLETNNTVLSGAYIELFSVSKAHQRKQENVLELKKKSKL